MPTITVVVEREMAQTRCAIIANLRAAEDTDFAIRLPLAGCAFRMAPRSRRGVEGYARSRPHQRQRPRASASPPGWSR